GVSHLLPAREALRGVHGDGAHRVLAQVLGHLEHKASALVLRLERVQDLGQVVLELHVDDGARDLANLTDCVGCHSVYSSSEPANSFRHGALHVMPGLVPGIQPATSPGASLKMAPGHKTRDDKDAVALGAIA